MASNQTFVIVGASLTGAKAAETLREEGFDGRVLLIGAEQERPYERPPLSKDYLRGESAREKTYVHEESFYAEKEIELRIVTAKREVALWSDYRYTIVSKSMEEDLQKFHSIVEAERHLSRRLALS